MEVGSSCIVRSHLLTRLIALGIHQMNNLHLVLSNGSRCCFIESSILLC